MSLLVACHRRILSASSRLPRRWQDVTSTAYDYMPLDSTPDASGAPGVDAPKPQRHRPWRWPRRRIVVVALAIVAVLGLALGLGLGLGLEDDDGDDEPGPVVDLGYANYTGSYLPNGISQYLGMRYARPPTDNLRWRAPLKPENEDKPQKAKEFGTICYGISESTSGSQDEDCLYVNVWGPTNATAEMKLPVMVFIGGGGYTKLANANWNGTRLIQTSGNNLVFVNFNYRVGLWGFLAGEEVRDDGDLNAGLLDQRFLLQWVQEHISKFGGDPNHVVIHGISAGAGSVALQLAAYGGRNDSLFVGAIAESIFIPSHQPVSDLEWQFDRTVDQVGCSNAESRMECLRGKSTKKLQKANVPSPFPGRKWGPLFYWTPCVDGDFLQDSPSVLYQENKFLNVPSLFGTCTNEGTTFTPPKTSSPKSFISFISDQYPSFTTSQAENLTDTYPMEPAIPGYGSWYPSAARAYGEATFICPTNHILDALANSSTTTSSDAPLYSYRYNVDVYGDAGRGLGVSHVAEAPAVFGPDMMSHTAPESYYARNADVVPLVMSYFVSFARTLDPNVHRLEGAPEWDIWGDDHYRMVLETTDSFMEEVGESELERCEFWKGTGATANQ